MAVPSPGFSEIHANDHGISPGPGTEEEANRSCGEQELTQRHLMQVHLQKGEGRGKVRTEVWLATECFGGDASSFHNPLANSNSFQTIFS